MKNIRVFLSENFPFLEVKFSIYLNRHVFVMSSGQMMRKLGKKTLTPYANSDGPDEPAHSCSLIGSNLFVIL